MKYKSIVAMQKGGPEALRLVENDLRPPAAGEARIRVQAVSIVQDDIAVRRGARPVLPKFPYTPGYSAVGVVDALGEMPVGAGMTGVSPGQRVAALTTFGGYAEYLYWDAAKLVHVPEALDPVQVAPLILNYLVAYQILHRVAHVRPGDTALIIGASGGCGTAFLQLGRLAGLKMYGLASPGKHALLSEHGAIPVDYHDPAWMDVIRRAEPAGLDFAFNGMAQDYFTPGLAVLRRGGVLVHFGGPTSMSGLLALIARLLWTNLLPNGKTIKGYGTHREDVRTFQDDWAILFDLLEAGQIRPIIAQTFPLLEAQKANQLFESGRFTGNIVLYAP